MISRNLSARLITLGSSLTSTAFSFQLRTKKRQSSSGLTLSLIRLMASRAAGIEFISKSLKICLFVMETKKPPSTMRRRNAVRKSTRNSNSKGIPSSSSEDTTTAASNTVMIVASNTMMTTAARERRAVTGGTGRDLSRRRENRARRSLRNSSLTVI